MNRYQKEGERGQRYDRNYDNDARYASGTQRSAYGPEDFRQGAHSDDGPGYANQDYYQGMGQRQWQGQAQSHQGQRNFAGQGGRGPGSYAQGANRGNSQPSRYPSQGAGSYARDFDQGDYDQEYGGYSPSQGGYGQSWSGYGRGGYGTAPGQGFDEEFVSSDGGYGQDARSYDARYDQNYRSSYGQGPNYSQGLANRGGSLASGGYSQPAMSQSQYGKGPKGYARSDDRLKEDISERLMRDHDIDASDVSVEVKNGAVTLTGSIDDRQLKHRIEDMAERCYGVKEIDNRLTVRSRQQSGSGSLGGSSESYSGQSAATGTTGARTSTGTAGSEDGGSTRSRN